MQAIGAGQNPRRRLGSDLIPDGEQLVLLAPARRRIANRLHRLPIEPESRGDIVSALVLRE